MTTKMHKTDKNAYSMEASLNTLELDKIASSTASLQLSTTVCLQDAVVAREGYVVAARVLERNDLYGTLEDPHGRLRKLFPGDHIVGVLGTRRALHGHGGDVPDTLTVGERLHVLNLGGVIGRCTTSHPDVGAPLAVELLGAVLAFPEMDAPGVPAHIGLGALPIPAHLGATPPIVMISGTCMNSGKTRVACEIVRGLCEAGLRVAAVKLTGVATRRDLLAMQDCGAREAFSFADAGFPSTHPDNAPDAARAALAAAAATGADVIVAELGDGLLGDYGVRAILTSEDITARSIVHICCASDPVGAFGASHLFEAMLGRRPDLFSGPVTDNRVGCQNIQAQLGVAALNAIADTEALVRATLHHLHPPAHNATRFSKSMMAG